jgi:hypothetical protein
VTERQSFDLTAEDLDTSFKLVPEGWHAVEIDDVDDELESSNGNRQYLIKYKSLDESFKGTLWDYVAVTKSSIQNIMSVSRAVGLPVPTKEKPGKYTPPEADDLIGKELQIEVVHKDDYKGATDDEGNVIKRAQVRFAGRKKIGEKTGVPASKAKGAVKAGAKAPAKAKATATAEDGFSL